MRCILIGILALATAAATGQTQQASQMQSSPGDAADSCSSEAACAEVANAVVRQFGDGFKLATEYKPLLGDLDGDGEQDAVVVVTGDPMGGQEVHNYKVIDPYDGYFGWDTPSITSTFSPLSGPRRNLLIVHSWRAQTPKAKFVIINLPFEHIALGRRMLKKKPVSVIQTTESDSLIATTYWDGKHYRWRPEYLSE